jgi:hypothetical protein
MADIQKNMIRALNEQKYLRNLQNEFKPKMIFKNQSEKKPKYIQMPKSVDSADSSAQTINESVFSNDISPFSAYSPFSTNSNTTNESSDLTVDDGNMSVNDDLNKLYESVKNVGDIFERYQRYKQANENNLASSEEAYSPLSRQGSNNNIYYDKDDQDNLISSSSNNYFSSPKSMSFLKIDSPRLDSFLNSINLLKPESRKNNAIKRIFVKSPDDTSGEETDSSSFSLRNSQKTNYSSASSIEENSDSENSVEDEEIKIRERKKRVLIKINKVNDIPSKLVPLKISFFGGSKPMTYNDCKEVIQFVLPPKDQNIIEAENKCDTKIQEIKEEMKQIKEEIQKLTDENETLKSASSSNLTPATSANLTLASSSNLTPANDMGLAQLLNKSLTGTSANSTNDIELEKSLNASLTETPANDMGLTKLLNASLTGTSASSSSSANDIGLAELLNTSLNGNQTDLNNTAMVKSLPNGSQENNRKYVVEITFKNETLEPMGIVINRKEKFDEEVTNMEDEDKPSNYLFSVNQFIMEQIKTKNKGYILEGETTMACYCSHNRILDFDTPVLSF